MKKFFRSALVLCLMMVVVVGMISGCGGGRSGLDGVWGAGVNRVSYEFSGNNVLRHHPPTPIDCWMCGSPANTSTERGTFTLSGNQIEFNWTGGSWDCCGLEWEHAETVAMSFSRTDNTITIGGAQFTRQ